MNISEQTKLIDALLKGTVTVTFQKVDTGEIRIMPCTLNPKVLKANNTIAVNISPGKLEVFPVWALDKDAWRSFILETVISWEVL